MKLVTLLLVAANLVLFAWLYTHQDDYHATSNTPVNQLDPAIERLRLLRERPVSESTQATTEQDTTPPPAAVAAESVPDTAVETEQPVAVQPETAPQVEAAIAGDSGEQADDGQPALAEASPSTAATTVPAAPPQPVPAPAPVRICQILGPFSSQTSIDALVHELSALGVETVQRTSQMEQPSGYWVYLPTMPRAEAKRIADELASQGVKDYFLGRQNFISLGVFSDKRTAEMRVREIAGMGYEPRLEPRFLTHEVYWLDLEEQTPNLISDDRWRSLLGQQEGVRRQTVACE